MRRALILPSRTRRSRAGGHLGPLPAVGCALLLAACGAGAPELDGVWTSEREVEAQVTIKGDKVTMTVPRLKPTVCRQRVERTGTGYLLHWTTDEGEVLRVEARLDGDRLLLALGSQEFALRRAVAR